jgi:hypothetical protein
VSDLRPSKLTEPDPERDFGDWRKRRKRTTTDGSADAGATALVELVGVDCPNDCPVPSCRQLPGMPRAALGLCHRCMSRHRTTRDGTTRQIRFRVEGLVPLTGRRGSNPPSDTHLLAPDALPRPERSGLGGHHRLPDGAPGRSAAGRAVAGGDRPGSSMNGRSAGRDPDWDPVVGVSAHF